jgi:hypothetical protein
MRHRTITVPFASSPTTLQLFCPDQYQRSLCSWSVPSLLSEHRQLTRSRREGRTIHKNRFGLFIRTIGIARAEAKLTLATLAYDFDRLIFQEKASCHAMSLPASVESA